MNNSKYRGGMVFAAGDKRLEVVKVGRTNAGNTSRIVAKLTGFDSLLKVYREIAESHGNVFNGLVELRTKAVTGIIERNRLARV